MITAIRLLRNFLGFLLAAVALLATVIAAFMVIAMTMVWWQEGRLNEHDLKLLGWGGLAAAVGALFTWAGFRLARGRPKPGEARVPSFTLMRSPGGRQERFVESFSLLVYLLLFGGWLWGRVAGEPWARGGQVVGWLTLLWLGLHARVFLHELGHLAAAWLLRMDLVTLRVGTGPTLRRGRTRGNLDWEWRLRPTSGYAEALHPPGGDGGFRVRQFLFVAGGPLVDACLVGALWSLLPQPRPGALPRVLADSVGLSVGNLLLVLLSVSTVLGLVPRRVPLGDRVAYTDGWWLFRLAFARAARVREWTFAQSCSRLVRLWGLGRREEARTGLAETLAAYPDHRATLTLMEGRMCRLEGNAVAAAACFERALTMTGGELAPALRPSVLAERAAALAAGGDPERARAECAAALAGVTVPAERVVLLDAFDCLPILHLGARALLPDAEAWCAEALTLAPDRITLRGTLGALLIEQGRDDEGATILREVRARTHPDLDRGIGAFYLALVARRQNRVREWQSYRREARRLCAVPVLLGRIETELCPG